MTISDRKPRPLDQQLSLADMLTLQSQQHQRAQQVAEPIPTPSMGSTQLITSDNWQPELARNGYRSFEPMA